MEQRILERSERRDLLLQVRSAFWTLQVWLHAMKALVSFKKGIQLERWVNGLAVMLENQANCTLVEKLHFILLMEVDFNFCNTILMRKLMMEQVQVAGMMADKIFSDQNRTVEEGCLTKVLIYYVIRQTRKNGAICSVDAYNC